MKNYLLDTNICIYIINNKPISVYEKFKKLKIEQLNISAITVKELSYGVFKSQYREKNSKALKQFLRYLSIIPFDENDAVIAGENRVALEKKGSIIGPYDLLIGSQAQARNMVLVTNNQKEFSRLDKLKIENWL